MAMLVGFGEQFAIVPEPFPKSADPVQEIRPDKDLTFSRIIPEPFPNPADPVQEIRPGKDLKSSRIIPEPFPKFSDPVHEIRADRFKFNRRLDHEEQTEQSLV